MKVPDIELSECIDCMGCLDICPSVFYFNEAGYIEIIESADYPHALVNEAILSCPARCISWSGR